MITFKAIGVNKTKVNRGLQRGLLEEFMRGRLTGVNGNYEKFDGVVSKI